MPEHTSPSVPARKSDEHPFRDLARFLVFAIPLVILFRMYIAQPFIVRGESMVPTFHDSEYLIVDEISYAFNEPVRGDVVVLRYPLDPKQFFIKRVIGLPGETVQITGGSVTIINPEHPDGLTLDEAFLDPWQDTRAPITLEADEYFVMGDNRGNSSDSRRWGPVTRDEIVGRAFLRLWPASELGVRPGDETERYQVIE